MRESTGEFLAADAPDTVIVPGATTYVSMKPMGVPPAEGEGVPDFAPASPFVLKRRIGQGGQGDVWEAWQTSLNREVAVKIHRGGTTKGFLGEAFLTGELDHPNIVPVLDLGRIMGGDSPGGLLAMAMKRVRGCRWDELIANERPTVGVLSHEYLTRHLKIVTNVCHAVAYAHSRGIVHLDLKPSQVIVGNFGEVYLMDWGLAARLRPDPSGHARGVHQIDEPIGTPGYMAPEQAHGDGEAIGIATDIYLLGALVYHVVAGHPPHPANTLGQGIASARRNAIIPLPAGIPEALGQIILKSLSFSGATRHHSAEAFRVDLEGFLGDTSHRHEAQTLLDEAAASLNSGRDLDYAELLELERAISRARTIAPSLTEAASLRDRALQRHASVAIARGDLELATILAGGIELDALRCEVQSAAEESLTKRHQRERQRVLARGVALLSLALLATVLGVSSQLLFYAFREAEAEREMASQSLTNAQQALYHSSVQAAFSHAEKHRYQDARHALREAPQSLRGWEWGLLSNMASPEHLMLAPRNERFSRIALDKAQGSLAAIRSRDGALCLYNAEDGSTLGVIKPPAGDRWWVVAASGSDHGFVVGSELGSVGFIASNSLGSVSHFGARIEVVTGSRGHTALGLGDGRLILLAPDGPPQEIRGANADGTANVAAWSTDGNWLAVGFRSGLVGWFDRTHGEWMEGSQRHTRPVSTICWNPIRAEFVTIACDWTSDQPTQDRQLFRWNPANPEGYSIAKDEWLAFTTARYSQDGAYLYVGHSSANLRRFETTGWKLDGGAAETAGTIQEMAVTSDGRRIVTVARNHVTVRDIESWSIVREFEPDPIRLRMIEANNTHVFAAGTRGGLSAWALNAAKHTGSSQTFPDRAISLDASSAAPYMVAGHGSGNIRIWNTETCAPEGRIEFWHVGQLLQTRISADGSWIASITAEGMVRLQDRHTLGTKPPFQIHIEGRKLVALAIAPRGTDIVFSSADGLLQQFHGNDSGRLRPLAQCAEGHHWTVLEYADDGTRVFAGRDDGLIETFSASDGAHLGELAGHVGAINRLEARDGFLVSASEDQTARLWDAGHGEAIAVYRGSHASGVVSAALTRDGRRILTACRDWNVRVFDRETHVELLVLQWHQYGMIDLALAGRCDNLFTLGREGNLRWWKPVPWLSGVGE